MNANAKKNHYENVSLMITHYNRSKSLERLLEHFDQLDSSFKEVIVSDDGSKPEHLSYLQTLKEKYAFTLVTTPKNKGLGNNINKGQDAVKTEYTLYVQEDFLPLKSFDTHFKNGLELIEENKEFDIVRFYSYLNYPNLKPFKYGFSEMIFDPWSTNIDKIPMYSDHPHLRRSNILQKFGRYPEMKNPEKTEYDMMLSFLQKKGRGLFFANYKDVFDQGNSNAEPSTMNRKFWRFSNNFFINKGLYMYRLLKFNYSYYFKKFN
ncbi:MAG: glycosyltransferase [Pedobacter sp.]|nr:MAG: glycosyltransferase [Pedobacter sp.]